DRDARVIRWRRIRVVVVDDDGLAVGSAPHHALALSDMREGFSAGDEVDVGEVQRVRAFAFRPLLAWSLEATSDANHGGPQVLLLIDAPLEDFRTWNTQSRLRRKLRINSRC